VANSARGERTVEIDGAEFRLRFSINAICELEDQADQPIEEIGTRLSSGRAGVRDIRLLWWAALRDAHGTVDLKGAGELIDRVGLEKAIATIGEVLADAFPAADSGTQKKTPRRRRSRGPISTPTPSH
jgi:hypothetical protein